MESVKFGERGQILVQVAIMVGVLFAFVALAVDAGNVYGGRRRMQNAADAGALAGAREICFGNHGDLAAAHAAAETAAREYAEDLNGAPLADVEIRDDYIVVVTAEQTLDTFFAGVIGINTADVRAEAAAACGGAVSAEALWPLAFNMDRYYDNIPCGQEFYVFAGKDADKLECAGESCDCLTQEELDAGESYTETDAVCDDKCNCADLGVHLSTADRGWLLFPDPEEPYDFPSDCSPAADTSCAEPRLACWLAEDYPDEISIGDCIPGQSGMVASNGVEAGVQKRADNGDILRIVLWDETECEIDPDGCPGEPYYVADFGCIEVVDWVSSNEHFSISECSNPEEDCQSAKNLLVIKAVRICNEPPYETEYQEHCSTSGGSTAGGLPENWDLRSVSLIQWPRPADE